MYGKIILCGFVAVWLTGINAYGQTEETLRGIWVNEAGTRKVEFRQAVNAWTGQLIWAKDNSRLRPGDTLFENLSWDGRSFNGKLIAPRTTAPCSIVIISQDKIEITGSKGGMSKSVLWTRVK